MRGSFPIPAPCTIISEPPCRRRLTFAVTALPCRCFNPAAAAAGAPRQRFGAVGTTGSRPWWWDRRAGQPVPAFTQHSTGTSTVLHTAARTLTYTAPKPAPVPGPPPPPRTCGPNSSSGVRPHSPPDCSFRRRVRQRRSRQLCSPCRLARPAGCAPRWSSSRARPLARRSAGPPVTSTPVTYPIPPRGSTGSPARSTFW